MSRLVSMLFSGIGLVVKWIGMLYLGYVALVAFVLMMFVWHVLWNDLPKQWKELWRARAEAEVVRVIQTCRIREPREPRSREPARYTEVPCERVEQELAVRPKGARRTAPRREAEIQFVDDSGDLVRLVVPAHAIGLATRDEAGTRITVSYDPARPVKTLRKARDRSHVVIVLLVLAGLVATVIGIPWLLVRRYAGSLVSIGQPSRQPDGRCVEPAEAGQPVAAAAGYTKPQGRHSGSSQPIGPRQSTGAKQSTGATRATGATRKPAATLYGTGKVVQRQRGWF